jgi:hypothetical protein
MMGFLLLLRRIPHEVWLILAALAALWIWGNKREQSGYDRAMQEATEAAASASRAYQNQIDAAEARDVKERVITIERFRTIKERAANAPVNPTCPDADGRRLLNEAVKAANDTAASPARR